MQSFQDLMLKADISFSYPDGTRIFDHLSFTAEKGEHILILSEPGSGKSTLSRLLTGALPGYAGGNLDGYAEFDGKDILSLPPYERMEIIGRVSQNTDEMLLFSSVEEEISFPLMNLGLETAEKDRRIADCLELFGLEKYRKVSTAELSGGEKRRLMLSILFAVNPCVYILDEAFDELSPYWRKKLGEILSGLERTVIVLGSHMLSEYDGVFSRMLSIEDGKVVQYVPVKDSYPPLEMKTGNSVLKAENIEIERIHRSSGSSFGLAVPSFEMSEGECITLLGDNGSGKSSFSRVLSGLLKEKSGRVLIDGKELSQKERRHSVAYLMQNPYEELFLPTVLDELNSTCADSSRIDYVLSLFSLERDAYVQELSYGKAKMLQAAIYYILDRPFVVFDEVDSAISYQDTMKMLSLFMEKGAGVLMISHDERIKCAFKGKAYHMQGGLIR